MTGRCPASCSIKTFDALINAASVDWDGEAIAINASFGVQTYGPEDDLSEILKSADDAMYAEGVGQLVQRAGRRIVQRRQDFAPARGVGGVGAEKEGHVGAEGEGQRAQGLLGRIEFPEVSQDRSRQGGVGVRR